MNTQDKQAILKARAKLLSRVEDSASLHLTKSIEVLEFNIASENYALETQHIREVHPIRDYTPLPSAPPFVVGLVSVRRRVLSLIDLGYFFDLPRTQKIIGRKMIVLEQGDMEFAILTEAIIRISTIPLANLQPPLPTLFAIRQELLKGLTSQGLIVLDAQKLLNNKQLIVSEAL